jgi:tRNA-splicing ligase RtcB (3'-phosphate/5'-hydroxy nucleic acid ligase)
MDSTLRENPVPYEVWGREYIDEGSFEQMSNAARLPIAVVGALMPDAHIGYGLPIGGVLATEKAVIPYAVGVDIACRMRMTIFPVKPHMIKQQKDRFKKALTEHTLFGAGKRWAGNKRADHSVMDDPAWKETDFLNSLKTKAHNQLGTSGSGNHFVEWGSFTLQDDDEEFGLDAGEYLALLSHSGSRGFGYQVADRYSKIAMDYHPNLDKSVKHLAWLPLDWDMGREYWLSMELAGQYAAANHEIIHTRLAKAINQKPVAVVENHHNFAWKETIKIDGEQKEVIVHRKGATPAGKGVLGIIPGSMGDSGFVVRGKGNNSAINSASHGAGRVLSRRKARQSITKRMQRKYLQERGIMLIGGDLDESPQAYKRIEDVIAAQSDLVDIIGEFKPVIVRMDGK